MFAIRDERDYCVHEDFMKVGGCWGCWGAAGGCCGLLRLRLLGLRLLGLRLLGLRLLGLRLLGLRLGVWLAPPGACLGMRRRSGWEPRRAPDPGTPPAARCRSGGAALACRPQAAQRLAASWQGHREPPHRAGSPPCALSVLSR
jgi:hypothetical protein